MDPLVLSLLKMLLGGVITSAIEAGYEVAKDAYEAPLVAVPQLVPGMPLSLPRRRARG